MDIRFLEFSDYEDTLVQWWKDWRWEPPKRDFLPGNGESGLMVSHQGVDICAGFIYLTNSKAAWSEFIISNFNIKDKSIRNEAILILINALSEVAKDHGCEYVFTSIKNESLLEKYTSSGYEIGSKGCYELIKKL